MTRAIRNRRRIGAAALFVSVAVPGLVLRTPARPSAFPGAAVPSRSRSASRWDRAVAELVDDYVARRFAFRPDEATPAGRHEFDERLPDFSPARIRTRLEELKRQLRLVRTHDPASLTPDQAIDLAMIEGRIRSELRDLDSIRSWRTDVPLYAGLAERAVSDLIRRDFAPPRDRLREVIKRINALPAFYATAKANVSNPPRLWTQLAIRKANDSEEFFEGLVNLWAREVARDDPALLREFLESSARGLASTRDFAAWLERSLLPRSNGRFPMGEANLLAALKDDEQVELPPAELLRRGEAQLARDRQAFLEAARRVAPDATPDEVMRRLSDEHPPAARLTVEVVRSAEAVRRFLVEKSLVTIPAVRRPNVRTTPPFFRSPGLASIDLPGPWETGTSEAYYNVRPVLRMWESETQEEYLRAFNPYANTVRAIRDLWPGDYLRFLCRARLRMKARAYVFSSANADGWAYYADQMLIDQGIGGDDPRLRFIQLRDALLIDCRYLVALRLHALGMRFEEAADVFVSQGSRGQTEAEEEARWQAYRPTGIPALLGKLLIQDLHDDALRGNGGSLRDFHDAFLAQGYVPIPLARKAILR